MKILFLGDVVGISGCSKIMNNLLNQRKINNIDFVIVNAENADDTGVGLTKEICEDFFSCGVNVITTGNHVWDQKAVAALAAVVAPKSTAANANIFIVFIKNSLIVSFF